MKNVKFNKKYKKFNIGLYIGFGSEYGHIYDHTKIVENKLSVPTLAKRKGHSTLLYNFNINKSSNRSALIYNITKNCKKYKSRILKNKVLFLGSSDGEYDSSIMGWTKIYRDGVFYPVLVYSLQKLLDLLHKEGADHGMTLDDAYEHWSYNMVGSWLGTFTPVYQYED